MAQAVTRICDLWKSVQRRENHQELGAEPLESET
jgi:hypothetical protein